jgi:hypothetical protein
MSYLVDMLKPSKENEFDTYVMHINRFGESIVYKLDPDGPPKTFVTGTVDETLGYPLKGSLTAYRVVKLGPEGKQPHYPFAYGLGDVLWRTFVKVVNGKGARAGRYQERLSLLERHDVAVPYIEFSDGKWVVTEAGKAFDEKDD